MAEVMAAANGVWLAAHHGAKIVLIQSDCMAVVDLVNQKVKAERLLEVWAQLHAFELMNGVQVSARHVKGHARITDARTYVNHWCDREAGHWMRKGRHHAARSDRGYQPHRQDR